MPKPFMLTIEIEEIAVGPVIRRLTNMPGIVALHMDLDKLNAKPGGGGFKKNGEARKPYTPRAPRPIGTMRADMLALLKSGKPMESKAIHAALNPSGGDKQKTSVRNTIYNAKRDGFIKQAGDGKMALAEKGRAALKAKVA